MDRPPKYVWPKFAALAVLLGLILGVIWMTVAVRKLRSHRDPLHQRIVSSDRSHSTVRGDSSANASTLPANIESGRKIFFERPEASCAKCHAISGYGGGDLGPPLDGIGSRRSREELLDALLNPNARVLEGYESIIVLLESNTGISGLLKKETDTELHILTPEDGMTVVKKEDVRLRQRGLSPMPEGLASLLTEKELSDLIEFMASLREPAP